MEENEKQIASITEFHAWDDEYNGVIIFLIITGVSLFLLVTVPDIIRGCNPNQLLTSFGIGICGFLFPFTIACFWIDQKSTKFTLFDFDFCIIHERFPFLNKQYDLRNFTKFHIGYGRYGKRLFLYQDHGATICIPILGTIPQLIKAIDARHKMQAK